MGMLRRTNIKECSLSVLTGLTVLVVGMASASRAFAEEVAPGAAAPAASAPDPAPAAAVPLAGGVLGPLSPEAGQLDSITLLVNGKAHVLKAKEQLTVVRGDRIVVSDGRLINQAAQIGAINFIGFPNGNRAKPADDRGYKINTAKSLLKRFVIKGEGELYAVAASTYGHEHGRVFVKVVDPTLRSVVVKINDAEKVLHNGEAFSIKASDKIKVERVDTNMATDEGVTFKIQAVDEAKKSYELCFLRGGRTFGRIPLQVAD